MMPSAALSMFLQVSINMDSKEFYARVVDELATRASGLFPDTATSKEEIKNILIKNTPIEVFEIEVNKRLASGVSISDQLASMLKTLD